MGAFDFEKMRGDLRKANLDRCPRCGRQLLVLPGHATAKDGRKIPVAVIKPCPTCSKDTKKTEK